MDKQSLNRWLSLIHDHAGSLHDAISDMDHLVRTLFSTELVSVPEPPVSAESHSLLSEADMIAGLVSDEEHILSRSFVLSPQNQSFHDVDLALLSSALHAFDTAAMHITEAATELSDGVAYLH